MDSQAFDEHVRHTFDAYCKKVIRNRARDIFRELERQTEREVSLSEFPDNGAALATVLDDYFADERRFETLGFNISIKSELLTEALRLLPDGQREIILRHYFLGMTDREIGETSDAVRRTVSYQRAAALKKLKRIMEEIEHGE